MSKRTDFSLIVDSLLKVIALGGISAVMLVAPNAIQLFDKPLKKMSKELDRREKERQIRRALTYMKSRQLITEDYQHGLQLTKKAKLRMAKTEFDQISIASPRQWDKKWRLVFFDIPEPKKSQRDAFAARLRREGMQVLQRSVFVHPFPCRQQVEQIAAHYEVGKYVSYIEASYIENQAVLVKRFSNLRSVL